jgi:hypothetical protein
MRTTEEDKVPASLLLCFVLFSDNAYDFNDPSITLLSLSSRERSGIFSPYNQSVSLRRVLFSVLTQLLDKHYDDRIWILWGRSAGRGDMCRQVMRQNK